MLLKKVFAASNRWPCASRAPLEAGCGPQFALIHTAALFAMSRLLPRVGLDRLINLGFDGIEVE
jgi:hypothetical protein